MAKRGGRTALAINLRYWQRAPGILRYRVERGRVVGDLRRLGVHVYASAGVRTSEPVAALFWVLHLEHLANEFDRGSMWAPPGWIRTIARNLTLGGFDAADYVNRKGDPSMTLHEYAKWAVAGCAVNLQRFEGFERIATDAERGLKAFGLLHEDYPTTPPSRAKIRNPEKKMRSWDARQEAEWALRFPDKIRFPPERESSP